jgi:hypothetical protein
VTKNLVLKSHKQKLPPLQTPRDRLKRILKFYLAAVRPELLIKKSQKLQRSLLNRTEVCTNWHKSQTMKMKMMKAKKGVLRYKSNYLDFKKAPRL